MSTLTRLRGETRGAHSATERTLGFLMDPGLTVGRYGDYLRAFAVRMRAVAASLPAALPDSLASHCTAPARWQALRQDAADWSVTLADAPPALHVATPDEAVGWLYVVEGSRRGGPHVLARVGRSLSVTPGFAGRHLAAGERAEERWTALGRAIDRWGCRHPAGEDAAVRGALDAFQFFRMEC